MKKKWIRLQAVIALLGFTVCFSSCSKQAPAPAANGTPTVETDAVSAPAMKNCQFKNQKPVYAFNSTIQPNPIVCDDGFPRTVQVLSPSPLPAGLSFNAPTLSLVGTATEKMAQGPYKFYLENEAGYTIINLTITVQ